LRTDNQVDPGGKLLARQSKGFADQPLPAVAYNGATNLPRNAESEPGVGKAVGIAIHDQHVVGRKNA
jgi:hypothetical protein